MEGSYERQIEKEIMGKLNEKINDEVSGLYKMINNLKARHTGYLIVTGLVASLIGGSVGYVLNNRSEKEIKDLDTKVSLIYLQSTMPDNLILPDNIVNDDSIITNPSKSLSGEVMEDFNAKRLIQPVPVPESNKRLESSIEGY